MQVAQAPVSGDVEFSVHILLLGQCYTLVPSLVTDYGYFPKVPGYKKAGWASHGEQVSKQYSAMACTSVPV